MRKFGLRIVICTDSHGGRSPGSQVSGGNWAWPETLPKSWRYGVGLRGGGDTPQKPRAAWWFRPLGGWSPITTLVGMTWSHQSDRMWPFQLLVSKIPSTLIHFAALHWVGANSPSWGLPYSWSIGCRNGSFLDGSFWRAEDSQAYGSDQVRCGGWQQSLWCFRWPSGRDTHLGMGKWGATIGATMFSSV